MAKKLGTVGDDAIIGTDEQDYIYGDSGNDRIDGGAGDDWLEGGAGADVFIFQRGHGDDRIEDFQPGTDIIDLSAFNYSSPSTIGWSALQANITTVGGGALIDLSDWGGGTISLYGVTADQLTEDMFKFLPDTGTDGADELHGWTGNDTIYGRGANDTIYGYDGHDALYGGRGRDILEGGDGHDRLVGGTGKDELDGGLGDDVLYGGAGKDTLTGGAGDDTFVYNSGDGHDRITDFGDGEDRIDLIGFSGITEFSQLSARQDGDDVVIEFPGHGDGSITLEDFDLSDLDANDFFF